MNNNNIAKSLITDLDRSTSDSEYDQDPVGDVREKNAKSTKRKFMSDSDTDFEVDSRQKKGKKSTKKKNVPIKVFTPGTQNLPPVTNNSSENLETRTIDSIETIDPTIDIQETDSNFTISYSDASNKSSVESVAARLAAGQAVIGVVQDKKVLINISPKSQASLVIPDGNKQKSKAFNPPTKQTTAGHELVESELQLSAQASSKEREPKSNPKKKSKMSRPHAGPSYLNRLDDIM